MSDHEQQAPAEDPILTEAPTVTIAGRDYQLRRLGLRDTFAVSRILGRGVAILGANAVENLSPGQSAQVIIASLAANEQEVMKLLASVLQVDREALDDPERFPMDSIITVIEALAAHQDMRAFFAKLSALQALRPEMQTRSPESSKS